MKTKNEKLSLTLQLLTSFAIIIILMGVLIFIFEDHYINVIANDSKGHNENLKNAAEHFNAAAIVILTIFILCAGWLQFRDLNKTSRGDFLFRIDERYGQPEIIKARVIIHKFYCLTYHKNIDCTKHTQIIGEMIYRIKFNPYKASDFIALLNFLDFLETISYFANRGYISVKDLNELTGYSIKFYYSVFTKFIDDRRNKYKSDKYYCELQKLAKYIQKNNPTVPPFIETDK
ncbi:hypothetical protein B1207_07650 [Legionella quinlivanii]|uniref:DUF4760 domain-containing protein n=1 Tax=Legionella quinlivanii TaxID=45073 RepID=A0A364LJI1_9GAMM|nr:DUF4760 domain-containing protein [Legionella quinlivanii]RAP36668.1 hypothetical protein B1207_07650 [Legionella quinlivanii]